MRKAILFSVLFSFLPLLSQAQDDLYFTPSKAEQSAYQQAKIDLSVQIIIVVLVKQMKNIIVVGNIHIKK